MGGVGGVSDRLRVNATDWLREKPGTSFKDWKDRSQQKGRLWYTYMLISSGASLIWILLEQKKSISALGAEKVCVCGVSALQVYAIWIRRSCTVIG